MRAATRTKRRQSFLKLEDQPDNNFALLISLYLRPMRHGNALEPIDRHVTGAPSICQLSLWAGHFLPLVKSSGLNSTACSKTRSNCLALADSCLLIFTACRAQRVISTT